MNAVKEITHFVWASELHTIKKITRASEILDLKETTYLARASEMHGVKENYPWFSKEKWNTVKGNKPFS